MKKLILSVIVTGAAISSLIIVSSVGCGSPDEVGKGTNAGGTAGTPTYKLDGSVTSQGGAGGRSSGPPAGDASCGRQTATTTREPPDVLLVLDRSASMYYTVGEDCFCSDADAASSGVASYQLCPDTTNCQTRWSAVKPAVIDTVSNSKDVQWGLKFFPTPNASQCSVSREMEVLVGPDSANEVKNQVENVSLSLGTPTAAAIKAATDYLKTVDDNRPKSILLATDGEPNCRGGNIMSVDVEGAAAAAKAAYNAGFPVYVVGIGPNLGNLTRIASDGGTGDYFPVSSPDQLVKAFEEIQKLVASCTFTLEKQPGADLSNVGVYVDKQLIAQDPNNGWSFGGGNQTVVLNGSACEAVTSGKASTVELFFGCPGQPPPPAIP